MSPSTNTRETRDFAREMKFRLAPDQAELIRAWARQHLPADPNAANGGDQYQITSLYFDTQQFDVFHRRGSYSRAKYRVRRYDELPFVFLERKLKTGGMVAKRRNPVDLHRLAELHDNPSADRGEAWFHRRLRARQLRAVCEITYHRTARVALTDHGPVRLTLDTDIKAMGAHGMRFNGVRQGTPVAEGTVIMELKFRHAAPALFKRLIEEYALNPAAFSKYRQAAVALGYAPAEALASPGENHAHA